MGGVEKERCSGSPCGDAQNNLFLLRMPDGINLSIGKYKLTHTMHHKLVWLWSDCEKELERLNG